MKKSALIRFTCCCNNSRLLDLENDWTSSAKEALWRHDRRKLLPNALPPIRMIEEPLRASAALASGALAAIDAGSDLVAVESLMDIEQYLFEAERLVFVACLVYRTYRDKNSS